MAQERLQLVITADNREANSAFNQTNAQIGSMEQLAARVANSISRHFQQMATEIQRAIQNLSGVFNGLDRQAWQARQLVDQYGRPVQATVAASSAPSSGYGAAAGAAAGSLSGQYAASRRILNEVNAFNGQRARDAFNAMPEETKKKAFLAIADRVNESETRFKKLQEQFGLTTAATKQNTEATHQNSDAQRKNAESMAGSMVKAMLWYQVLEKSVTVLRTLTVDSAMYAARTETLGIAMDAVSNATGKYIPNVQSVAKSVKALGITTQDSYSGVTKLMAANIDLSKATDLARASQDVAVVAGMNSSQAYEHMIHAIVTLQPEMFRTLGLQVNLEAAYSRFAKQNKIAVDQLTNQQKTQIAVNEALAAAANYAGVYTDSLDSAGKKLTSLQRYIDEAKNSIGQQFLPVLGAATEGATALAKTASEYPEVFGNATVAVVGLGSALGLMVAHHPILAAIAAELTASTIILNDYIGHWQDAKKLFGDTWINDLEGGLGKGQRNARAVAKAAIEQQTGTKVNPYSATPHTLDPNGPLARKFAMDDKHAKAVASALEQAREAFARSQTQGLEGVDKINAEHDEIIRKLKQEGVLTAQIASIYQQVKTNNLLHFGKELDKQQDDLNKESNRLFWDARQRMEEPMQEQRQLLEDYAKRSVDAIHEVYQQADQYQIARLQREKDVLQQQQQIELTQLDQTNAHTLASKLGIEQQKLQVRLDYINRERDAELKMLAFKGEIAKKEVAIRYAGQDAMIRKLQALIDLQTKLASDAATSDATDKAKLARETAIKTQYNLVYEANKKLYDQLKQSAEGVFDAMLTKSQSVWQAMANAFKMAFLTVLKEIVSSQIARSLTGLLTGQHVGLTPGGSQAGTGIMGRFGGLLGMAGVGAAPVFGGGGGGTVTYSQSVQGGGGVAGTVNSLTGGNGISSVQKLTGFGGASAQTWSQLAGLDWHSATVGGKTVYYNAINGITLSPAQYAQMKFFGKFGKAGGAIQSAMMAGGLMMGADAMMRGGALGVGEAAMGGAMIGTSILPGIGTLVGAGIGALAGVARMIIGGQTPEQKMKERVRTLTGVDIGQKNILRQMVEMARSQFAGNYDLFIRSKNGQDFIEMYAQQTGQKFRSAFNARSFSMLQSGGSLYELPTFSNGSALNPMTNLPGMGFSMALDQIQSGGMQGGPMSITVRLDGPATTDLMRGEAVQVIVDNPRLVQSSSLSATKASANRRQTTAALLSPGTQFA